VRVSLKNGSQSNGPNTYFLVLDFWQELFYASTRIFRGAKCTRFFWWGFPYKISTRHLLCARHLLARDICCARHLLSATARKGGSSLIEHARFCHSESSALLLSQGRLAAKREELFISHLNQLFFGCIFETTRLCSCSFKPISSPVDESYGRRRAEVLCEQRSDVFHLGLS
jgi:hypothetical protein